MSVSDNMINCQIYDMADILSVNWKLKDKNFDIYSDEIDDSVKDKYLILDIGFKMRIIHFMKILFSTKI